MTPKLIRASVVSERASWVRRLVEQVRQLPIDSLDTFESDHRNVAAAESFIRRSLEALFDRGRPESLHLSSHGPLRLGVASTWRRQTGKISPSP